MRHDDTNDPRFRGSEWKDRSEEVREVIRAAGFPEPANVRYIEGISSYVRIDHPDVPDVEMWFTPHGVCVQRWWMANYMGSPRRHYRELARVERSQDLRQAIAQALVD